MKWGFEFCVCYKMIILIILIILIDHLTYLKIEPICPKQQGYCVTSSGRDQNSGVKKLNNLNGDTLERQEQCLKLCRSVPGVTGCEVIWDQGNRGCYAHTQEVARGNGEARHSCWVLSQCEGIVCLHYHF